MTASISPPPMGTPIHAAAGGIVTYAGNELKDYGNLVLIKHEDGYVTAYAHADRLVVNRGDIVTKGQVIGYAGQTGDVISAAAAFRNPPRHPAGQSAAAADGAEFIERYCMRLADMRGQ